MSVPEEWRTQAFRQSVIARIDDAIRTYGMNTSRNSIEMENHVYLKAKTREEYLGFVARLILHVREMNNKKTGMQAGQPQAGGMPDPINALQNLASQGTRNNQMLNMGPQQNPMGGPQQQMGVNVFQAIGRGPGGAIPNMQANMQNRMGANGAQMGNQMNSQMGGMNQMGGQMPNQIPSGNMNQLGGPMQGTLSNQGSMPNQMGNQQPGQLQGQLQMNPGLQNPMGGPMGPQLMGFSRNPTPTQFLQQSPSSSVQSPAGMSGPPTTNQMVASPALAPSPGSNMGMMGNTGPPRSIGMAPSPGTSLNTPGQPIQSPMGLQDEQAYREKVRQLSKYIDPLRKMIARIGNDGENVEKLSKMKKLLEILSNPQQRMPLETLIKCEVVLEKMDIKRSDGNAPGTGIVFKESHIFSPLLEAISTNAQNPNFNHTLHRTFGPTLDALFGPELKLVSGLPPHKIEEPTSDIPDALQGEIARLDQRFKVSLDQNQQPGSKSIQLTCWLDDKHLPCVPPISIMVPEDYPFTSPVCHTNSQEYNATAFLSAVEQALLWRIQKLQKNFSVSQLLDTWEMSVRQAASGNNTRVAAELVLMGL
ncbi:mediator of RNA polymerase II transcription subunit 15 isoform X2 [Coccinella septempunctata]|uniref:mediator of RNA polymerase II transcription subunit 15 isoform X2 n=1 Tax=Coccinella septempunctata TaxID=41139 RepID=UPI001D05D46B|nr:mediator of RNA polymerase II transcription subunit 15 isoform X2 [Coccinella septempunctata]